MSGGPEVRQQLTLLAAAALGALGLTGAALLLPPPLDRAYMAAVQRVTDRIVTAADRSL